MNWFLKRTVHKVMLGMTFYIEVFMNLRMPMM